MKFLCVKCDTAMSLLGTQMYEDQGSIAVRYGCPKCPAEIAMLTNRAETQVVTSLGVQIGPQHDRQASGSAGQTEPPPVSKCPFGAMLQTGQESSAFGAVSAAIRQPDGGVHWSADASERLERVPGVVRQMARMGIEQYARDNGHAEVTVPVLDAAKAQFGF